MIDVMMLIEQCAPQVAPSTIQAIIRTESNFNPLAINVNGNVRLKSQPRTAAEAAGWSQWLIEHHYSVDMGLMQINSRNLPRLKLTPAEVFDPCRNIEAGAAILQSDYQRAAKTHGPGHKALLLAISSYNTGSFERGFRNGYVEKVVKHSAASAETRTIDLACVIEACNAGAAASSPHAKRGEAGWFSRITSSLSSTFTGARNYLLVYVHRSLPSSWHPAMQTYRIAGCIQSSGHRFCFLALRMGGDRSPLPSRAPCVEEGLLWEDHGVGLVKGDCDEMELSAGAGDDRSKRCRLFWLCAADSAGSVEVGSGCERCVSCAGAAICAPVYSTG